MIRDAIVKEDGTLIAKVPKSLSGKKIKITLEEKGGKKNLSIWQEISTILKEADTLAIPRRNLKNIISDIRTFREDQ